MIEDNVTIFPNCFLSNSTIGKGSKIYSSVIVSSKIGKCSSIGPFCYLKKTVAFDHVKIGAFCEIKNVELDAGEVVPTASVISKN